MTLVISSTFLFARPKVPSCSVLVFDTWAVGVLKWSGRHTLFFARRRARLSLELRRSSMTRFSYGASLQGTGVSDCNQLKCAWRTLAACSSHATCLSTCGVQNVTYPATSRVISRTNSVRLDKKPFLLEILGAGVLGVTSVVRVSICSLSNSGDGGESWDFVTRRMGRRTVAGVQADDEARLLLDFLRHVGGR